MAKRPITDELLNLTIETKLDAGVPAERIRVLVEAFAGEDQEGGMDEALVGFLWVEDIPPSRRAEFLRAVLALSPEPKLAVSDARQTMPRAGTSGVSFLTRAKAALRFVSA
jgi:hypothetical protein